MGVHSKESRLYLQDKIFTLYLTKMFATQVEVYVGLGKVQTIWVLAIQIPDESLSSLQNWVTLDQSFDSFSNPDSMFPKTVFKNSSCPPWRKRRFAVEI